MSYAITFVIVFSAMFIQSWLNFKLGRITYEEAVHVSSSSLVTSLAFIVVHIIISKFL